MKIINWYSKIIKWDMFSVTFSFIFLFIVLSVSSEGFISSFNLLSLSQTAAILTIVGIGQLMAMSVGHFNLALGSIGACSAILAAALMQLFGVPMLVAVFLGIVLGSLLGFIQGFLIVKSHISPFVITLSLASIYIGLATGITKSQIYNKLPKEFISINKIKILNIPLLMIIAIIIVIIMALIINKTLFGRKLLATGENDIAALFAGLNPGKLKILAHSISGLLAGIAGVLVATRLGSAQISIGVDWLMVSFAAPVLGGSLLSGGKVSVVGTILGASLMAMITNGLVLLDVNFYWFQTFIGFILIGAFEIDRIRVSMFSKIK